MKEKIIETIGLNYHEILVMGNGEIRGFEYEKGQKFGKLLIRREGNKRKIVKYLMSPARTKEEECYYEKGTKIYYEGKKNLDDNEVYLTFFKVD